MADMPYGFDTLQIHAGAKPDPATGARQTPIYQNTAYVFRDADHAARALQPAGGRLHLLPPDQPDRHDAGRAARRARGRRRRGLHLVRPRGADHGAVPADAARATTSSPRTGSTAAPSPSSPTPSAASAGRPSSSTPRTSPRSRTSPTTTPGRSSARSIANPGGYVTDIPALAAVAKRLGVPLIVDNTSATPYLCRPIEHGRRHRRALDDQVPDRQRHRRRRRDRRLGQVRLVGLGQVPEPDRAGARLSRAEVPRDLRPDGLHLPLASPSACATSA